MPPNVFVALRLAPDALARVEAECSVTPFAERQLPTKQDLLAALADVEGVLGSAIMPIGAEVIAAAPKLRVISNFGVGFDNVDVAAATARGILVCNTPGVLSDAVADLTIGLIISLARRLPEAERFVREGNWGSGRMVDLGVDLKGKTVGIVGLGRIGCAVAKRARAFDMGTVFHDQFREAPPEASFCRYRALDDLLRESDFVTLHVNLSAETQHLIDARTLALMKPAAYLINTSRGPVVDQPALTDALQAGRIAGAALDVFEKEPLPADDPLISMPNVIVLPHIGSATRETRAAMLDLAIDNLLAALRGERPACVVNPEVLEVREARS
jgi:lactate dehydrogenase-like 2-hydroxyacid dehydrogenase